MSGISGTAFTIEAQVIKHDELMLPATPGRVSVTVTQAIQSSNKQYDQLQLFLRFTCMLHFGKQMSITLVGSNSEDPADWALYSRSLMVSKHKENSRL